MGAVYAARYEALGQRVALKVLLPEVVSDAEVCTRFLREARAIARIENEYVVRVIDVGQTDRCIPFIAMEFLRGSDLGDILDDRGPLETAVAVDYVLDALEALAEAHAMGMVHRDLKPS